MDGLDLGESDGFGGAKDMIGPDTGQTAPYGMKDPSAAKMLAGLMRRKMRKGMKLTKLPKMPRMKPPVVALGKLGRLAKMKASLGRRRGLPLLKSGLKHRSLPKMNGNLPKVPPPPYGDPAGTGGY